MRRRRVVRWAGVVFIVLVGLYFVLDVVALQYMQSRGSANIAQALAAESASLKLGNVPFLPFYLSGHLGNPATESQSPSTFRIHAKVRGATAKDGFGVQSIDVRASQIRFGPGKMFSLARSLFSARTKVTLSDPIVLVEIGEADLREYLQRKIPRVGDVQIKGSGIEVRFKIPQEKNNDSGFGPTPTPTATPSPDELLTKPARYLPRVEDGRFVLTLTSVSQIGYEYRDDAARIEHLIQLPPVPAGMTSTDVKLGKGVIIIDSEGKSVTLEVGEGPS